MSRAHLVRHGQAGFPSWAEEDDPGLDAAGRAQAEAMASAVASLRGMPVIVSPRRRTRETAAALERAWGIEARVEPALGEIPSPVDDLTGRGAWLGRVMAKRWGELDERLRRWREDVLQALAALDEDTVVVSHFGAINVAVGAATGDDRVVCFRPANCSRTVLDGDGGRLTLVELGDEAATRVL